MAEDRRRRKEDIARGKAFAKHQQRIGRPAGEDTFDGTCTTDALNIIQEASYVSQPTHMLEATTSIASTADGYANPLEVASEKVDDQLLSAIDQSNCEADARESLEITKVISRSESEVTSRENADLCEALMRSKVGAPQWLDAGKALRFKLTRYAQSQELAYLLNNTPELATARRKVAEAGCELQPEWAGGMWILLPITRDQFIDAGLQPSDIHIVISSVDEAALRRALQTLPKPQRPKLKMEHDEHVAGDAGCSSLGAECEQSVDEFAVERTFVTIRVFGDSEDGYPDFHSAPF